MQTKKPQTLMGCGFPSNMLASPRNAFLVNLDESQNAKT